MRNFLNRGIAMNFWNRLVVAAGLLLGVPALAAFGPIEQQQVLPQNILTNPGFENGPYGWTASGGATKTVNGTAKQEGNFGYDWDSNSASQTLQSASITIPAGLKGKNGLAFCSIQTVSGTATHTFTVNDGTNDIASAQT